MSGGSDKDEHQNIGEQVRESVGDHRISDPVFSVQIPEAKSQSSVEQEAADKDHGRQRCHRHGGGNMSRREQNRRENIRRDIRAEGNLLFVFPAALLIFLRGRLYFLRSGYRYSIRFCTDRRAVTGILVSCFPFHLYNPARPKKRNHFFRFFLKFF